MATLWITEYEGYGGLNPGGQSYNDAQVLREPAVATQTVTFTTATDSAAFNAKTNFVRVYASAACHLLFDGNDATTSTMPISAGAPETFAVTPGTTLSVIEAAS